MCLLGLVVVAMAADDEYVAMEGEEYSKVDMKADAPIKTENKVDIREDRGFRVMPYFGRYGGKSFYYVHTMRQYSKGLLSDILDRTMAFTCLTYCQWSISLS